MNSQDMTELAVVAGLGLGLTWGIRRFFPQVGNYPVVFGAVLYGVGVYASERNIPKRVTNRTLKLVYGSRIKAQKLLR